VPQCEHCGAAMPDALAVSILNDLTAAVRSSFSSIPDVLDSPGFNSSLRSRTLIVCGSGFEQLAALAALSAIAN